LASSQDTESASQVPDTQAAWLSQVAESQDQEE